MDKNSKEKELLYSWAENGLAEDIFPRIEKDCQSYFIKSEPREYLTEYQFEGIEEIRKYMERMWADDERIKEIEQILLVAAMKNKPRENMFLKSENANDSESLPAYIYNF